MFVHYDEETKKIIEGCAVQSATPLPCIEIPDAEWFALENYMSSCAITVSDDLKTLVVDKADKSAKDTQVAEQNVAKKIEDIDAQLDALDLKSIRSRGEILDGLDTDGAAAAKITEYRTQIATLRSARKALVK